MSDGVNPPQQPPRGASSASPGVPRSTSSQNLRALSASSAASTPRAPGDIGQRLKSGGANVALNTLSILKEMVQDFRQQDRFFKYKAFIVGGWLALSLVTLGTTCGRGVKTMGEYGAKLIHVPSRASLTIMNKGGSAWTDVTIVVKDNRGAEWRSSVDQVAPSRDVTITPKQLMGSGGAAPSDLVIRDVELRISGSKAKLMENGVNLTEEAPQ